MESTISGNSTHSPNTTGRQLILDPSGKDLSPAMDNSETLPSVDSPNPPQVLIVTSGDEKFAWPSAPVALAKLQTAYTLISSLNLPHNPPTR